MALLKLSLVTRKNLLIFIGSIFHSYAAYGNGALPISSGANNTGLAGAGLALPLEATGANINPALLSELENQASISVGIAQQNQKVDTSQSQLTMGTPLPAQKGALKNKVLYTPLALAGVVYHVDPNWSIGVSLSGGGGNTEYNSSPVSPAIKNSSKFDTEVLLAPLSLAWKPTASQSYGLSLILGRSTLITNFTLPNGKNSKGDNRTDAIYGLGGRFGGLWHVAKFLSLGAIFATPIYFENYHKYSDLIKTRFMIPMRIGAGSSWHLCTNTDLLADVEGYFWGQPKSTGSSPAEGGLGWRNTYAIKVGINHRIDAQWTVRIGYAYNEVPVPQNNVFFNAFSPSLALIENSLAAGVSYQLSKCFSFNLNALYGFENKLRDNGNGVLNGKAKNTTLSSQVMLALFGFVYKY